jgi:hypothetical protein
MWVYVPFENGVETFTSSGSLQEREELILKVDMNRVLPEIIHI